MGDLYERRRFSDAIVPYFPTEACPVLPGGDAKEDFFAADHSIDVTDFSVLLPAANPTSGDVEIWLPFVFDYGSKNKSTVLTVASGTGGSGALTKIVGSGTLTAAQVRIYPTIERFDFHSSLAATTVYFTGKIVGSALNMQMIRRLFSELNATQTSLLSLIAGGTLQTIQKNFTASTDVVAGRFGTLNSDNKILYAGNTAPHLAPFGFLPASIASGDSGALIAYGFVESAFTGLVHGQPIYIKNDNGEWTQDQDDLDDYDHVVQVGRAWGSTNALINCAGVNILLKKDV